MREPITLLIDTTLREYENLPVMKKGARMLWITSSRRWITSSSRGKADGKCRSSTLSRYVGQFLGVKFRRKSLSQGGKKAQAALRDAKNTASTFFLFCSGAKDLRISRKKSCGRVNSVIAWSLYTLIYIRAKALQLASRMLPASFFVLARGIIGGTFARWCAHTCRIVNIYEVYSGGEGGRNEKSLANLWWALCSSAKSRIQSGMRHMIVEDVRLSSRDGHPRPCISPSGKVYYAKYQIDRKDLEIDCSVGLIRKKKFKCFIDFRKNWCNKTISLFI